MKLCTEKRMVDTANGRRKILLLRPKNQKKPLPGILWIHGGGYALGMAAMVHASCGKLLAKRYGAVVVSPEYTLSGKAPYPAALEDCYAALKEMYIHAAELQIDPNRLIVGGESAGGGLAAAVCLYARDRGEIPVFCQFPLYPMLDCRDTPSSKDNRGKVWNTKRNRWGWSRYLGALYGTDRVPKYASPSLETDYRSLPPCFTYVCDGEPFYDETLAYVRDLREAGVPAEVSVFHGDIHAFDYLFWTKNAKAAKHALCEAFEKIVLDRPE